MPCIHNAECAYIIIRDCTTAETPPPHADMMSSKASMRAMGLGLLAVVGAAVSVQAQNSRVFCRFVSASQTSIATQDGYAQARAPPLHDSPLTDRGDCTPSVQQYHVHI